MFDKFGLIWTIIYKRMKNNGSVCLQKNLPYLLIYLIKAYNFVMVDKMLYYIKYFKRNVFIYKENSLE